MAAGVCGLAWAQNLHERAHLLFLREESDYLSPPLGRLTPQNLSLQIKPVTSIRQLSLHLA